MNACRFQNNSTNPHLFHPFPCLTVKWTFSQSPRDLNQNKNTFINNSWTFTFPIKSPKTKSSDKSIRTIYSPNIPFILFSGWITNETYFLSDVQSWKDRYLIRLSNKKVTFTGLFTRLSGSQNIPWRFSALIKYSLPHYVSSEKARHLKGLRWPTFTRSHTLE